MIGETLVEFLNSCGCTSAGCWIYFNPLAVSMDYNEKNNGPLNDLAWSICI